MVTTEDKVALILNKTPAAQAKEELKPVSSSSIKIAKTLTATAMVLGTIDVAMGVANLVRGRTGGVRTVIGLAELGIGAYGHKMASAADRSRKYVELHEKLEAQVLAANVGQQR